MDIKTLAATQKARLASARERNRAEADAHGMGWVGDAVDLLRANGFQAASVAFMDDGDGWTRGKRDEGPWVDGELIVRAAGWNARVYGKDEAQRGRVKRLRKDAA